MQKINAPIIQALPHKLIQTNVPLKDKNWFATGGLARYYAQPTTGQEFEQALLFAHENNVAIFVLGQGANILISDDGFDGLVIRPQLQMISFYNNGETSLVTVGAGMSMHDLILACLDQ